MPKFTTSFDNPRSQQLITSLAQITCQDLSKYIINLSHNYYKNIKTINPHNNDFATGIAIHPQTYNIYSISYDKTMKILSPSGELLETREICEHAHSIAIDATTNNILISSSERISLLDFYTINIYSPQIKLIRTIITDHTDNIIDLQVNSITGHIISNSLDGTLKIWV